MKHAQCEIEYCTGKRNLVHNPPGAWRVVGVAAPCLPFVVVWRWSVLAVTAN